MWSSIVSNWFEMGILSRSESLYLQTEKFHCTHPGFAMSRFTSCLLMRGFDHLSSPFPEDVLDPLCCTSTFHFRHVRKNPFQLYRIHEVSLCHCLQDKASDHRPHERRRHGYALAALILVQIGDRASCLLGTACDLNRILIGKFVDDFRLPGHERVDRCGHESLRK